jgi:hypothetical protein
MAGQCFVFSILCSNIRPRNLVNCVNNITLGNPDCGAHAQLSPEGKKHDSHQMSEFTVYISNQCLNVK